MPAAARRRSEPESLVVPEIPWRDLFAHLRETWKPGEHVTLIGPNGAGKTHVALQLADLCRYVLVLATKRRDPLVSELRGRGYVQVNSLEEIPVTAQGGQPVHHRVLLWSNPETRDERLRRRLQARALANALATAERQGRWAVVVDETMWFVQNLGLSDELDSLWFQARTSKVSVIACAQRPTKIPRMMVSQATHVFLWHVSDRRDLEPLRELGGVVSRELIEENVAQLDWHRHEFLYFNAHSGFVARSVADAR